MTRAFINLGALTVDSSLNLKHNVKEMMWLLFQILSRCATL